MLFEVDKKHTYLNVWAQNKELLLSNNIYNVLSKRAADTIMEAFSETSFGKPSTGKHIFIDLPDGQKHFELSVSKKLDGNYLVLSRDISAIR